MKYFRKKNLKYYLKKRNNDEMLRKTLLYSPLISPKTPFKHAIEQEIHEQDEAVYKCLGYGWRLSQNYEGYHKNK